MNYYPHHIGDYLKDTAHLSMIEDGAYRRLLDLYYLHEAPLPADKKQVYRLARAASAPEKKAVDTVLTEYFHLSPNGWTHKRCDAEIMRSRGKSEKAKQSAASRWHGNSDEKRNANASSGAMRMHSEGNAYPIANNQDISVPNGTAGEPAAKTPEEMTKDELWRAGKSLLNQSGMPVAQCGSFVGKLVKDYGNDAVVQAVRTAVVERPADPASFLRATCQRLAGERAAPKRPPGRPSINDFSDGDDPFAGMKTKL